MMKKRYINDWRQLVHDTEKGYRYCLCEFENDLSVRMSIEQVLGSVEDETILRTIQEIDQRFVNTTRPRIGRPFYEIDLLNRVPNVLVGDLAEDVENLGI